jgi:hypothetical protein
LKQFPGIHDIFLKRSPPKSGRQEEEIVEIRHPITAMAGVVLTTILLLMLQLSTVAPLSA